MELLIALVIFIAGIGAGSWLGLVAAKEKIEDANRRWRVATNVIQEIEAGVDVATALSAIEETKPQRDKSHPIIDLIHRLIDEFGPYEPNNKNKADQERQRQLRKMWSDDRRRLEIERAKNGLPQFDDLRGMWSDDKAAVMKAHIKHRTAR
jgi:hypothetical protein